jgi:hypothetical protein
MIFEEITPDKQMRLAGWSCTTPSRVITIPEEDPVLEFCPCDFFCEHKEFVFVNPEDPTDPYTNDYKGILINLRDSGSSYEFFIVDSSGVETPLIDNTYGELFDVGFNTLQPLKAGYRVDWVLVYNALGGGVYKIRIKQTDFGNTVEFNSDKFRVSVYNETAADGTVKIETVQRGTFLNGEDYEGMEWPNMVRIEGHFGDHKPQYELNRLQNSLREDVDVQINAFDQYTLQTKPLPNTIGDKIANQDVFTDEIFISNYDVLGYRQYRRLPVVFEGTIDNSDDYRRNSKKPFQIVFKDKTSKEKRNFV